MFYHESIFSLILVICVAGLLYPYAMKGSIGLIRLTSVYRPVSLLSFFFYALVIVLQPGLGQGALVAVPFLAMNGICSMAMELRALDGKVLDPGRLAQVDLRHQVRRSAQIGAAIFLAFGTVLLLPIDLAAVVVNVMLALGFGWAAGEALLLWQRQRRFNLMTTLISCLVSSICMTFRAVIYLEDYGRAQSFVFPEPDAAFMPRVIASFGVMMAAIAFNYEYLGRLADHERSRGERLDERLFSALARILERRTQRPANLSFLIGECAHLLAAQLLASRKRQGRIDPRLPNMVRRCAPVADIGRIGMAAGISAEEEAERAPAMQHTMIGENFFRAIGAGRLRSDSFQKGHPSIRIAAQIAGGYAEHWDGSGAPLGRMANSIPLPARIVAVARSYALAMAGAPTKEGHAAALDLIRAGRGTRFDPDIVDVLLANEAALAALMGDWHDRTDG